MSELHLAVQDELDAYRPPAVPPFETVLGRKRSRDRRRTAGAAVAALAVTAGAAFAVLPGGGADELVPAGGVPRTPSAPSPDLPGTNASMSPAREASWQQALDEVCRVGALLYPSIALGDRAAPDDADQATSRLRSEVHAVLRERPGPPPGTAEEITRRGRDAQAAWRELATAPATTAGQRADAAGRTEAFVAALVAAGANGCGVLSSGASSPPGPLPPRPAAAVEPVAFAGLPGSRPAEERAALASLSLAGPPPGWTVLGAQTTASLQGNGYLSFIELARGADAKAGGSIVVSAAVFPDQEQARAAWQAEQRIVAGTIDASSGEERFYGSSDDGWRVITWVRGRVLVSVTGRDAPAEAMRLAVDGVRGSGR